MRRSRRKGQFAPHLLHAGEVHLADQDLLLVGRGLGDHDAEGIGTGTSVPQNSSPGPAGSGLSWPTRLTTAT